MGLKVSRSIEIQISNETRNITLRNPRTYFFSGHSFKSPEPSVPPGSSSTCKFRNNTLFWGCNGVLAFEAESFTLAIYFSNPIDYNRFSPEMGLELSRDEIHKGDLEKAYDRMVRISDRGDSCKEFPSVILKESQEKVQLSICSVKVTATMSRVREATIKVKVEDERSPDRNHRNLEGRTKSPCRARHVQEK